MCIRDSNKGGLREINKYFKTLSLNKKGTFNFENDAAYLNIPHKNYKFAVTTDTILENIDS